MRNKIISVLMCVALSFLVLSPSYLSPKKAHAIAPAIPIVVGVGAVLASALAAYGISSVSDNHTTSDIGQEFINWISTKNLDDFWDKQTDIKTAQMAINGIYQMGLEGSINLADWTYNEQNAIYSCYGELLQLWAADNFGLNVSSYETVYIGDFAINTFYSNQTANSLTGDISHGNGNRPFGVSSISDDGSIALYTAFASTCPTLVTSSVDDAFAVTFGNSNNLGNQNVQLNYSMDYFDFANNSLVYNHYVNSNYFPLSSISFNTYYDIQIYRVNNALSNVVAHNPSHNDNTKAYSQNIVAYYSAANGTWTTSGAWAGEDVSVAAPDELTYNPWDDALYNGINDLLDKEIPVSSDMVYNPSLQALEGQGSIPVTFDWSQVLDWADVLNGTRAGTLDGSQSIDGTTSTTAVNTASGTLSTDIALDTALDTPYLSITPNIGSIGGAMGYAGGQMLDKFPFCTIRDLQALADFMNSPAQAPYFDLPLVVVDNGSLDVVIQRVSLAQWEPVAVVLRFMIGLLIILGFLRVATRQLKIFNEE